MLTPLARFPSPIDRWEAASHCSAVSRLLSLHLRPGTASVHLVLLLSSHSVVLPLAATMDPQQLSYPSFPVPSTATEGSSLPVRTRRGPPPKSCTACRLRRVRCTKEGTDDKPCQACEKKGAFCRRRFLPFVISTAYPNLPYLGIACIFTEESKAGAAQAGRRNETAKMLCAFPAFLDEEILSS